MKKILSLILAGLMTVSCAAFVAADDAAVEPAADPIQAFALDFLHTKGIWKGVDEGEFVADAESNVQRYQMALLVSRISTGWLDDVQWMNGNANDTFFDDINDAPAGNFKGALSYANQNRIIEGYSATKFAPYDGITYRDALTMVVRTMGWKDLNYPWGYIEKAVELGLTESVDAAYTDELTRGEVAEILYFALFADTKDGESLAKSVFGFDYGWRNIIIVSTDKNGGFDNKGVKAPKAGFVGFKVVDEDGKIGDKTYYVNAKELGLDKGHDAELAVGSIYVALFTEEDDLATIEKYESAKVVETVRNIGITDNEGNPVATQPIVVALAGYEKVKEHYGKEYLTFMGEELFVYEKSQYKYSTAGDKSVAVDYATGDIYEWDQAAGKFVLEWKYQSTLGEWYRTKYDEQTEELYLDWMSQDDFNKWFATAGWYDVTVDGYALMTAFANDFGTAPYAKLDLYNLDSDYEVAEVASYKDYRIANFAYGETKCSVGNVGGVNHPDTTVKTYTFTDLNADNGATWSESIIALADHTAHDDLKHGAFGWFNVADDVIGFENEDGTYNAGVVIYDLDKTTGEIEVVKYIPENAEGTDKDSYITTGVLQAYSTANDYIMVDGEKLYYGYDNLLGNTLVKGTNTYDQRQTVAEELDKYLMQYVKVLVVDGKVVDVDLLGSSREVIVVYDYAGVTSDGFIAVYGYSTVDGALKIYKINSYNGWKKGDYRYYPENAKDDKAFERGTLYTIKSHETVYNSYGVETYDIGDYGSEYPVIDIDFNGGYRITTDENGNETAVEVAKASDCYIIVTDNGRVFVTTGAMTDEANYGITNGYQLYKDGGKYVIYAEDGFTTVDGFKKNANGVGIVLYDKDYGAVLEAAFDDAQGVEDYYLLGSTVSAVRVYNVLTGSYETVLANMANIDLKDHTVYITIGNVIVDEWVYDGVTNPTELVDLVAEDYAEDEVAYADYIALDEGYTFGSEGIDKVEVAADLNVVTPSMKDSVAAKVAAELIKTVKYEVVSAVENKKGEIVGITVDEIKAADLSATTIYTADAIYDVANKTLIVYIWGAANETITSGELKSDLTDDLLADGSYWTVDVILEQMGKDLSGTDDKIELDLNYAGNYIVTYDDLCDEWSVKSVTLNKVGLNLVMDEQYHDEAEDYELGFGNADDAIVDYAWINGYKANLGDEDCCGLITSVSLEEDIDFVKDGDVWTATARIRTAMVNVDVVFTFDYNETTGEAELTYTAENLSYFYNNDFKLGAE